MFRDGNLVAGSDLVSGVLNDISLDAVVSKGVAKRVWYSKGFLEGFFSVLCTVSAWPGAPPASWRLRVL